MSFLMIISFTCMAALLVMSPGPNLVLIVKNTALYGKRAGYCNVAGFVAAFYVHGTLSILGLSVILVQSAQLFFIVKLLGAMYLIWLGLKAWHSVFVTPQKTKMQVKPQSGAKLSIPMHTAFIEGFLTNALNPKVSMFYLAAFPHFMPTGTHAIELAFLLVLIHSLLNMIWFSSIVFVSFKASQKVYSQNLIRGLKALTGTILIAFGIKVASLKP